MSSRWRGARSSMGRLRGCHLPLTEHASGCQWVQHDREGSCRPRRTITWAAMSDIGRMLVVAGLVLALVGVVFMLGERFGFPRLPGDITIRRDGFTLHFPLATSIVVSV